MEIKKVTEDREVKFNLNNMKVLHVKSVEIKGQIFHHPAGMQDFPHDTRIQRTSHVISKWE